MADQALFDSFAAALRAREETTPSFLPDNTSPKTAASLAVYRNNVRSSLSKALAETFPVVVQLVGEDFFKLAAREYFNAHPPRSPLIVQYGDKFPAFLDQFEPAAKVSYLADMARLEYAWLTAYRAADMAPRSKEQLIKEIGADPSGATFAFHPSLQLITSKYPVASIWRRHQPNGETGELQNQTERILIARPRREVNVVVLPAGVFTALQELAAGATIETAFAQATKIDSRFDPQSAFQTILSAEVVTAVLSASPIEKNP